MIARSRCALLRLSNCAFSSDSSLSFCLVALRSCFTIKERVTSDTDHFKSSGKVKVYEKSLFYVPNLGMALSRIAELKAGIGDFNSLDEYLKNYETITNEIIIPITIFPYDRNPTY